MLMIHEIMKMLHQILYLLLILTAARNNQHSNIFVEAQSQFSFSIKDDFSCGPKGNFACNGNATTTEQGLLKLVPDPKGRNETGEYYRDATGSALYNKPLRILDRSQNKVASFSASFSFQIELDSANPLTTPGDGMAFVLFPNQSFMGHSGSFLGTYRTDFQGTVLAVEFDTFTNAEYDFENETGAIIPIAAGHVGINVNVPKSLKAKYIDGFSLDTAKRVFAWVDYNSTALSFDVRVSNESVKPGNPFLSYRLNMFDTFGDQEQVWVGFSAANGYCHSFYTVYDLGFRSTLQESHAIDSPTMPAPPPAPEPMGNVSPSNVSQLAPEPMANLSPLSTPWLGPLPGDSSSIYFYIDHNFRCGHTSSSEANMICNGNATTTKDGLLLLLQDQEGRNESNQYYENSVGTALLREPVRFLDLSTRRAASFSAIFSFSIEVDTNVLEFSPGDGIAFGLFADTSNMGGPAESVDGFLTSFDENTQKMDYALAVEFDTYLNKINFTANHTDLDVDFPYSWEGKAVTEFNFTTVKRVYAWIDYDSKVPKLEVRVSSNSTRPKQAFFTYPPNLFTVLAQQEVAYVGLAARHEDRHTLVSVYNLSFTSNLGSSSYPSPGASTPSVVLPVMGRTPIGDSDEITPVSQDVDPGRNTQPSASPAFRSPTLMAPVTFFTWTTLFLSRLV